jgi:glutaminase
VFSTAEIVTRESIREAQHADYIILNFRHVLLIDLVAAGLIQQLARELIRAKKTLVLSATRHLPILAKVLKKELPEKIHAQVLWSPDSDLAWEQCENLLIQSYIKLRHSGLRAQLKECEMVRGFKPAELRSFEALLVKKNFQQGQNVIQIQDPALELYFLMKGKVSAWLDTADGEGKRLATFTPGMVFGEMALLDRSPRSARVAADTDLECYVLPLEELEKLAAEQPQLMIHLLHNLALLLAQRLRKANAEIRALYQ